MSSEGTSAMSEEKDEKSVLVPRRRFPGFDAVVSAFPLAAVADLASEKTSVNQITSAQYVSTENLLSDFGGMNPAVKLPSVSSVTSFRPNDVLVSNIRPYLRKVWQANIFGGASNDVLVIRPTERIDADYLAAILRSDLFINYVMRGAKGVKMPRGEISMIQEFPVPCPSATEQQKIAAFLSSLDELITAETQKLDTLKTHKKGLMQQLFPREGETAPRLRFPDFREAGEWNSGEFASYIEVIDGDRGANYPKAEEFSESGYCLFLNAKNVTKNGFKFEELQFITKEKDEALKKGRLRRKDLVLTTRGSVGQFAYFADDISHDNMRINSGMVILRIKSKKVAPDYLYAFTQSPLLAMLIESVAFGNAQQQLTVAGIKKFPIYYPELDEQQKIADCLSFLNELITAQSQKVDALKTHKKGLMQQLFPVSDEVRA